MKMERNPARRRSALAAFASVAAVVATCVATGGLSGPARAADATFPDHPIRIIVPFSAGGVVDSVARILAERLSTEVGQPVIVENRTGAGGAIGTDYVAKSRPDGYTLLVVSPSHVVGPLLNTALTWDPVRDFRAIAGVGAVPNFIVVPASSAVRDLPALLASARQHPGTLTYASAGIGTSNHLSGELLAQMTGVKMTHVPYKGQPDALTDLLGNRVSMMALTAAIARQQVRSGKLVALAVTSSHRTAAFPAVPTVAEAARLPGYEVGAWFGLVAPRRTPDAVVGKLEATVAKSLADPAVTARLADLGMEVAPQSARAFDGYVAAESRKWTGVLRTAGIRAE